MTDQSHVHLSVEEFASLVESDARDEDLEYRVASCHRCSALFGEMIQARLASREGRLNRVPPAYKTAVLGSGRRPWWGYGFAAAAALVLVVGLVLLKPSSPEYPALTGLIAAHRPEAGLWLTEAPPREDVVPYRSGDADVENELRALADRFDGSLNSGSTPDGEAGRLLVTAHVAAGKLRIAEVYLRSLQGVLPETPELLGLEAVILHARGENREAAGILRDVVLRWPQAALARANLAAVEWELGRLDAARGLLSDLERARGAEDPLVLALRERVD